MRKTISLLLALLVWHLAFADVVNKEKALRIAADFFTAAEVRTKASAVTPYDFNLIYTFPQDATKSYTDYPTLYVLERESGGYAIVSGDDVARSILGYSLSGRFPATDMPENLKGMLQWYSDVIEYARSMQWSSYGKSANADLDPANTVQLHTAQWNQRSPFNDLVQEIDGEKPPIGCVATAISIVMQYYKWPKMGNGTLPSYDYYEDGRDFHVNEVILDHEYDWSKMPDNYRNCTAEEAAQMARLLYDVAVMCHMSFSLEGSGSSINMAKRLVDYFDYDKQILYLSRSYGYSDDEWEQFVRDDLNAGRPVLFSASNGNSGHAFVIDGYNGRYFSINYGWGGGSRWRDGHNREGDFKDYYTLTPLEGHMEDLLVFNEGQNMVTHIMPNQGGEPEPVLIMSPSVPLGFVLPSDFEVGKTFVLLSVIQNKTTSAFARDFRYELYDKSGQSKEVISPTKYKNGTNDTYVEIECKITKPLSDGDHIRIAMLDPTTGNWVPLPSRRNGKIFFTDRRLSNLVEFRYYNLGYKNYGTADKPMDICLLVYKDVIWELKGKDQSLLLCSDVRERNKIHLDFNKISWNTFMYDNGDPQCETALFPMWLPSGSYVLSLRNPLTHETMEVNLEL